MEPSKIACGKYKELLKESSLKAMIILSQYMVSEWYIFSKFFGNVGPHEFIHVLNYWEYQLKNVEIPLKSY